MFIRKLALPEQKLLWRRLAFHAVADGGTLGSASAFPPRRYPAAAGHEAQKGKRCAPLRKTASSSRPPSRASKPCRALDLTVTAAFHRRVARVLSKSFCLWYWHLSRSVPDPCFRAPTTSRAPWCGGHCGGGQGLSPSFPLVGATPKTGQRREQRANFRW